MVGIYNVWLRFQNCLLSLVYDTLFDSTVTLCIILNTAFLAVEHHGMSEDLKHVLDIGNQAREIQKKKSLLFVCPSFVIFCFVFSGLYIFLYPRSNPEIDSSEQGILCEWLEHLRSHHRDSIINRFVCGKCERHLRPSRHALGKNPTPNHYYLSVIIKVGGPSLPNLLKIVIL